MSKAALPKQSDSSIVHSGASNDAMYLVSEKSNDLYRGEGNKNLDELSLQYSTLTKEEVDDFNSKMDLHLARKR